MWEKRQIEMMQRLRAERDALQPPPPPPRRRGRPTLIEQVQAQIVKAFVDLPEDSPLLARVHGRLGQRVAEARARLGKGVQSGAQTHHLVRTGDKSPLASAGKPCPQK
jgi:hypothetical protein